MSEQRNRPGRGGLRGGQRGGRPGGPRRQAPKPPSARDAALNALQDVVRNDAYAAQALGRQLDALRLSEEDRRLAASIFYFAVENRLYIETMLGRFLNGRPEPLVNDILHIAAAQILFMDRVPDHAAVDEAVKQVRAGHREGLTGLVNGVLRNLIRARDAGELTLPDPEADFEGYLSVKYSLAPAVARRMAAAYGREAEAIAAQSGGRREQTVRPNRMRMNDVQFAAYLDGQGYKWRHDAALDVWLIRDAGDLSKTDGYRRGEFSIQGIGAMEAGRAVGAKPGMQILDACAAPGGKTCLMAEAMGGSGRVYAWDVHEHRVALIRAAARRLGLDNVRASVYDARVPREDMKLSMDAVLVDAPCSGLGVIAEKPDIKYRTSEAMLDSLPPLQLEILEASAQAVKVGGLLVYATCTLLPEENGEVVDAFLEKHPEFEPDGDDGWLPECQRAYFSDGQIQLLPTMGVEGFFIARLRRKRI